MGLNLARCTPADEIKRVAGGSIWRILPSKRRWWLKRSSDFLVKESAPPQRKSRLRLWLWRYWRMLSLSRAAVNACGREFCASLCLLNGSHGYTCACPSGKTLHFNRHKCIGQIISTSLQLCFAYEIDLKYLNLRLLKNHLDTVWVTWKEAGMYILWFSATSFRGNFLEHVTVYVQDCCISMALLICLNFDVVW